MSVDALDATASRLAGPARSENPAAPVLAASKKFLGDTYARTWLGVTKFVTNPSAVRYVMMWSIGLWYLSRGMPIPELPTKTYGNPYLGMSADVPHGEDPAHALQHLAEGSPSPTAPRLPLRQQVFKRAAGILGSGGSV